MYRTRTFVKGLFVVGIAAMLCGYVLAAERSTQTNRSTQTQTQQQQTQQQRTQAMQPEAAAPLGEMLDRTSKIIGKKVKNTQNEDLGSVHDLVLTPDDQQVSYAAISYGGTFGVGAKYFAVPWSAIQVGPQGEIMLAISKNQLEQASGFSKNNWPAQPDYQLFPSMRQGQTPGQQTPMGTQRESVEQSREGTSSEAGQTAPTGTEQQGTMGAGRERQMTARTGTSMGPGAMATNRDVEYHRVTHLTGLKVMNPQGQDIGNIEDFVIDTRQGQVAYTIVSFGGLWGIGEKYAAVPASAVQLEPRNDMARLNADRKMLESVAFEPSKFPDLTNSQYAQKLHQTFNAEPYWTVMGYVSPEQQQQASEKAWGPQSEFARQFNAKNVATVEGTVQSVGTFQPEGAGRGAAQGLRIRLTTKDGKLVTVYAGPQWYAQQHDFYVKAGDTISVTGAEMKIGWRQVLVASQIKAGEHTLQLRNETGQPLWRAQMQGQTPQTEQSQRPGTTPGTREPGGAGQSGQNNQ